MPNRIVFKKVLQKQNPAFGPIVTSRNKRWRQNTKYKEKRRKEKVWCNGTIGGKKRRSDDANHGNLGNLFYEILLLLTKPFRSVTLLADFLEECCGFKE
jgi:hypothetical protein